MNIKKHFSLDGNKNNELFIILEKIDLLDFKSLDAHEEENNDTKESLKNNKTGGNSSNEAHWRVIKDDLSSNDLII